MIGGESSKGPVIASEPRISEEKKEEEEESSTSGLVVAASTSTTRTAMPVAVHTAIVAAANNNNGRPPSASSNGSSGGGPLPLQTSLPTRSSSPRMNTTATSRRGGRTRSRSPPVVVSARGTTGGTSTNSSSSSPHNTTNETPLAALAPSPPPPPPLEAQAAASPAGASAAGASAAGPSPSSTPSPSSAPGAAAASPPPTGAAVSQQQQQQQQASNGDNPSQVAAAAAAAAAKAYSTNATGGGTGSSSGGGGGGPGGGVSGPSSAGMWPMPEHHHHHHLLHSDDMGYAGGGGSSSREVAGYDRGGAAGYSSAGSGHNWPPPGNGVGGGPSHYGSGGGHHSPPPPRRYPGSSSASSYHHHHLPHDTRSASSSHYRGGPPPTPDDTGPYGDRRYRGYDSDRMPPSRHPHHHHRSQAPPPQYAPEYRYDHHRDMRGSGSAMTAASGGAAGASGPMVSYHKSSRNGGTCLVIGGPTPIHIPKSVEARYSSSSNNHHHERPPPPVNHRGAASVFRGRPGESHSTSDSRSGGGGGASTTTSRVGNNHNSGARAHHDMTDDMDNPQKILLSLRTPTSSFEDKAGDKGNKKLTGLSLSPDEPPLIQHAGGQGRSPQELFEPQRSPEGSKHSGPIELAPSFTLFNQSFDSFADTNYNFNVDSTLQADSFGMGMGRTNSLENDGTSAAVLQKNFSGAGLMSSSQQLLTRSGSGPLSIGYSPVNSFGNVSVAMAARRAGSSSGGTGGGGSNMMVLGGPDIRAASPSQVLTSMYRSYSGGGGPRPDTLDDTHLRMSVGSFGGQSLSYGRTYDSSGASPHSYYNMGPIRSLESGGGPDNHLHSSSHSNHHNHREPSFYSFLRKYHAAFRDCLFVLPGLKAATTSSTRPLETSLSDVGKGHDATASPDMGKALSSHGHYGVYGEPSPQDMAIARRRVESSICAFGGNLYRESSTAALPATAGAPAKDKSSIFRGKDDPDSAPKSATVTPSSSVTSPPNNSSTGRLARARANYEESLPTRYYENKDESRLSWEFEENPPVEVLVDEDGGGGEKDSKGDKAHNNDGISDHESVGNKTNRPEDGDSYGQPMSESDHGGKRPDASSPQPNKMRYRCKLCGQPKQNHRCPYQQSLARSIGVMVYPSVNAFTAAEPGVLAANLADMNNFFDSNNMQRDPLLSNESSPNRPTPERMIPRITVGGSGGGSGGPGGGSSAHVTPESRSNPSRQLQSPPSFAGSSTAGAPIGGMPAAVRPHSSSRPSPATKKRSFSQLDGPPPLSGGDHDHGDLLFVESMDLKPEQFRVISPLKGAAEGGRPGNLQHLQHHSSDNGSYKYPALPLPFAQRKRLSDNLFSLSSEVRGLTDECAKVLREAREKDLWDRAVAELMTQVIVVLHCHDGDARFEGLRQYLLTLGIAC